MNEIIKKILDAVFKAVARGHNLTFKYSNDMTDKHHLSVHLWQTKVWKSDGEKKTETTIAKSYYIRTEDYAKTGRECLAYLKTIGGE